MTIQFLTRSNAFALKINKSEESLRDYIFSFFVDTKSQQMIMRFGDGKVYQTPLSFFEPSANSEPDFTKALLDTYGVCISFGSHYEVASTTIRKHLDQRQDE